MFKIICLQCSNNYSYDFSIFLTSKSKKILKHAQMCLQPFVMTNMDSMYVIYSSPISNGCVRNTAPKSIGTQVVTRKMSSGFTIAARLHWGRENGSKLISISGKTINLIEHCNHFYKITFVALISSALSALKLLLHFSM